MSIQKKPYEISVWEDVMVYVGISGTEYSSIAEMSEAVKYQYYTERELAIIGSSTMTSPARTINNVLKKNINGVETLTFDMYYQYEDIEEGKIVHNPLIDLVIDERKVKLHYDNKWYDFIVKKDDEKGRDYKYSFTCTGLAANELGKTGFNIELDTELENNTGTVQELGAAVLEGSDWQLAQDGQEVIQQTNDEALYLIQLNTNITGTIISSNTTKTINSGSWIYVYYTSYINQVENYFQFIYVDKSSGLGTPDLYEDKITIYCNNVSGGTYDLYVNNVSWADGKPSFEQSNTKTVADYRGRRHVRKQLMDYDPVLEQTVYKYKGNLDNKDYYGYTTTEFLDATSVTNYIYNSTNFSGTSYWTGHNNTSIDARVYPDVNPQNANTTEFNQYLIIKLTSNTGTTASRIVNDGILQNYSRINSFEKGEYYRFKIWVGEKDDNSGNIVAGSIPFKCIVKKYVTIDEDTNNDVIYFTFNADGTQVSNTGYYYVDAQCANSATWEDLSSNVGIFLYPLTSNNINKDYYIKDIQLYRRISNNNGGYLDIGDVPEVRIITHYHFYDPSINLGKTSAEDYVFADNNKNNYTPLYGSGANEFEKVRSITAKESNRFNLLQELSETFECWVRFEIEHEANGQIKVVEYNYYESQPNLTQQQFNANKTNYYLYSQYDKVYVQCTNADTFDGKKIYYTASKRMRQNKNVVFYGEILQDNYVGFKYGINLKDNNRTLDSEQIVTKIIVKDNTCEAAENGFCSIARAQDNPIKENFALNLDYYVTQGLLNGSNLNNDLYLELNKSIGLYPKLSRYNKERNSLIETQALEANSINRLTAEYQAAQLTYNEAEKSLSKLLDSASGTIVQYTGYQYEDFSNQYTRTSNHNNVPAYKNEVYFIKSDISNISPAPSIFCIKNPDSAPVSGVTYYTLENNHFKVFNGTKFSSTQIYYKGVDAQYTAKTYFQTSNSTTTLSFSGNNSSEVYIYAAARRVMVVDTQDCINDNYMISKMAEVVTLQNQKDTAEVNMNKAKTDLDNVQADYDSIKSRLSDIAKATEEIEKDFNTKYSRYVQEGSWTDDNYMDDDLYYFDALDVLYQSAYPKVSYNFKVLELSQLEGYEAFKFDIGHKTYVEDTEFFGYWLINGLKTPVKETVVVTEATLNLDEPEKNDLKVQNYKSHFEDLFQRITAATQSLEYHSGEYGRAAAAITPDGTVDQTTLQKSFATAAYIIQNSRDQSVVWDDTGIQATNLSDPAQVTRLASGGLLVSADGGQTWGVAISGYGINANYLNVGTIDADKINIMSGAYPTFKWDALGLRAYAFETDNGVIRSYDPTRYVAHDRFGIYGLNGYLTPPELNTVSQVEDKASFALTWNGLFIRASHRDGYVRISPTEDITLHSTLNNTDIIRGKFGLLGENNSGEEIYGLALYAEDGTPTVETKSTGTLWLKSQMDIGTPGQTNTIYIGVGAQDETPGANRYKVINVNDTTNNDKFIVYSDGTLHASGVEIEGAINASSGTIGPLSISEIPDTLGIRIIQNQGDTFRLDENGDVTPSSLSFNQTNSLEGTPTVVWTFGTTPGSMRPVLPEWIAQDETVTLPYSYLDENNVFSGGLMYLKCTVNGTYSSQISIKLNKDGKSGDAYSYNIESSEGYIINTTSTIGTVTRLTASFYKNGEQVSWTGHTITWHYKTDSMQDFSTAILDGLDSIFTRVTSGVDYIVNLNYLNLNSIQIYFVVDEEAST